MLYQLVFGTLLLGPSYVEKAELNGLKDFYLQSKKSTSVTEPVIVTEPVESLDEISVTEKTGGFDGN